MGKMYDVIGKSEPGHLLCDPVGADPIAISLKPGNGVVERGALVYRGDDGLYVPAAAADVTDEKSLAVLNETVDTDLDATVAEAAAAYRAGRMIWGQVTLKGGETLTAAMELTLRKQGITFGRMQGEGQDFNNEVSE